MNKLFYLWVFITLGLISCKSTVKDVDRVELTRQYFHTLNNSESLPDYAWLSDSLKVIEGGYDQDYSRRSYKEFLKWDSVFKPEYEILEIKQENDLVKAKVSKIDKRIAFLQNEEFITNQIFKFRNGRINTIKIEYLNFNETVWEKNKTQLLSWIDENHPELHGFIYDQTASGGERFLRAIELYENREKLE
ncbi:hypothetical protein [Christiangramia sp. SM2212]|uniref:Nuclear transport factor 2 family protein n=1 Tax=Christiangramia sediminicola TaxID=3073267 RepID=A0ABU1EL40_9FLAO|nr:hypothetical protein [Christiangramia sp. SM2212]MDR5589092.1 hypothetical protein [Christiangramia sp. SM2212]